MRRDLRPVIFYEDCNLFGQNSLRKYGRILITYLRSCGSIISLDRTTQVETSHTVPCIQTVHVAIMLVTGSCRYCFVWNSSHHSCLQIQAFPTSSKNLATGHATELLHIGKSLLHALLMEHLFLFKCHTRSTHTLRYPSTKHKLYSVWYCIGSHIPPTSSSHLFDCSHLHRRPGILH